MPPTSPHDDPYGATYEALAAAIRSVQEEAGPDAPGLEYADPDGRLLRLHAVHYHGHGIVELRGAAGRYGEDPVRSLLLHITALVLCGDLPATSRRMGPVGLTPAGESDG